MTERIIMAGFGGQGLMLLGKLLAQVAMQEGKHATFFPSYGTEVRGGTANCHVVISDDEIFSPVVEDADALIIMNQASCKRFEDRLKPDGWIVYNSSMVEPHNSNGHSLGIPATQTAVELGSIKVGNMVMVGAYNAMKHIVSPDGIIEYLKRSLTGRKAPLVEINEKALARGREIFEQLMG
ncbi:MAG: 2-oxoacid:ferredoxin oxidoreductase subunit gamma [Planctomycetes bacterium]|nr:2-oxoacid:ferredoxin oxidoreductase subunit gamma [Planctomycetota bacterium]